MKWSRSSATARSIRFASLLPLATSARIASATSPTVPKMMPTPAIETSIVQARPAVSRSCTSRKPTVVRAMTVMYSASSTVQRSSAT